MEEIKFGGWFKIGPYDIYSTPYSPSSIWIYREGGEAMETTPEKLLKVIEEFFKREM